MRVCHVVEATAGGSARIIAQLLEGLGARGVELTLVYSPERADPAFRAALERMPDLRRLEIPLRRAVGFHDLEAGIRLFRLLRACGPFDILHSHCSKAGALTRLAGLFLAPRPAQVYTPHVFYSATPGASPVYGWIESLLASLADAIVTVSPQEDAYARQNLRINGQRLRLIPNGAELHFGATRAQARRAMGVDDSAFVVGFVGRLVPIKNPRRLIETFWIVASERPDAQLVIVGEGEERAALESALASAGLTDRARFMGAVDAHALMPGFDTLLATSDFESFALVLVESLAAGVPVVTTPVGVSDMIVEEGRTGYRAGFEPVRLAGAVLKLAALTPSQRTALGAECRAKVQGFTVEAMVARNFALYESLLRRQGRL